MSIKSLKKHCLGFPELLSQSVAVISPTMTAALIIPVMYSYTGEWSWMSYIVGTLMMLFVAYNLIQFSKRSATSGSMYNYIIMGLGINAGNIGGLALIWAYLGIAMAGLTGFTVFAGTLLGMIGIKISAVALFLGCAAIAGTLAWKNVRISAMMLLFLEGASVTLISILFFVSLQFHGFKIDHTQFNMSKIPFTELGFGVVVAVFSLVGFESATAFGDEARNPLKDIPKAIIVSLLLAGVFFVVATYVEVQALHGYKKPIADLSAPLNDIARLMHIGYLAAPISAAAMISFFGLALSCINAGARIIYALGRHGMLNEKTASSHSTNQTPHIAISLMASATLIVPIGMHIYGVSTLNIFGYVGTLAAFGFIIAYALIVMAAPAYLMRRGQLSPKAGAMSLIAIALLIVPAVGTVYPIPSTPMMYFPYIFLVYMIIGSIWMLLKHRKNPQIRESIKNHINEHYETTSVPSTRIMKNVKEPVTS